MKEEDIKLNVTFSNDFEHDTNGALHALDKTNVAVFVISKSWFDDDRAQTEYQHTLDLGKPMIYIFRNISPNDIKDQSMLNYPNLYGTINDYEKTGNALSPMTLINLRKMITSLNETQKMQ